tara:strand:+ start:1604 stop:2452 length:849 start_codon:yes stop_codon:yes gene_type:complete
LQKIYPDFFIVGAPRSGTTSLHEYLNQLSEVFMCVKECGFFSEFSNGRVESYDEYAALFSGASSNQLIGESTAIYLRDPDTPKKIHDANPNAKIIIMLRDPIERAFSHYLMYIKNGYETLSFSKKLENYLESKTKENFHNYIIMPSFYFDSISGYVDMFGREKIKIIIYEEFAKNTEKSVSEILDFLNINTELPTNLTKKYNDFSHPLGKSQNFIISNKLSRNLGRRLLPKSTRISIKNIISNKNEKPTLQKNDLLKLQELFSQDVSSLKSFLERKLPWKNF